MPFLLRDQGLGAALYQQRSFHLALLAAFGAWAALHLEPGTVLPPRSWNVISLCTWTAYILTKGLSRLSVWDKRELVWAVLSCAALLQFLAQDPSFKDWGDVYFFCGSNMEYCTCNYRWNTAGWVKAAVLWNFVLSSALGMQRLLIQLGLKGLLPGEEVVTRESFVSIGWRLIPYWLNNWEQHWGAECSSVIFELPHFALELLVILPSVQILCSRMKVLAMPLVYTGQQEVQDGVEVVRAQYAPNVLKGCWERAPEQRNFKERLRRNRRIMLFALIMCSLAAINALVIPLALENQILAHPKAAPVMLSGTLKLDWASAGQLQEALQALPGGAAAASSNTTAAVQGLRGPAASGGANTMASGLRPGTGGNRQRPSNTAAATVMVGQLSNATLAAEAAAAEAAGVWTAEGRGTELPGAARAAAGGRLRARSAETAEASRAAGRQGALGQGQVVAGVQGLLQWVGAYQGAAEAPMCSQVAPFRKALSKHYFEVSRIQTPHHRTLIPLVEAALAMMRLSCEKFFVLLSLFTAFLLFHEPPRAVAAIVGFNGWLSSLWQRVVLLSFPAVCWVYGAGVVFSTFVSVVFWGGPVSAAYEAARRSLFKVRIAALRPATAAELDRMGDMCAICWSDMTPVGDPPRSRSPGGGNSSSSRLGVVPHEGESSSPRGGGPSWEQPDSSSSSSSNASGSNSSSARSGGKGRNVGPTSSRSHSTGGDHMPGSDQATSSSSSSGASSRQVSDVGGGDAPASVGEPFKQAAGVQGKRWWQRSAVARHQARQVEQQVLVQLPDVQCQQEAVDEAVGQQGQGRQELRPRGSLQQQLHHGSQQATAAHQQVEDGGLHAAVLGGPHHQHHHQQHHQQLHRHHQHGQHQHQHQQHGQQEQHGQPEEQQQHQQPLAGEAAAGSPGPSWVTMDSSGGPAAGGGEGWALPCGHAYHQPCLTQWLQQCHARHAPLKCPMCQALVKLQVRMQLPQLWRGGGAAAADAAAVAAGGGPGAGAPPADAAGEAAGAPAAAAQQLNNFLLLHQPRLADLLLDMPQILAPEHQQLALEVQDLQQQRQQLLEELQLHRQAVQELQGRQQQLEQQEMEMEAQQRQLQGELLLLRRLRELLAQQQQRQQQETEEAAAAAAAAAAGVWQQVDDAGRGSPHQQEQGQAATRQPHASRSRASQQQQQQQQLVPGAGVGWPRAAAGVAGHQLQRLIQEQLVADDAAEGPQDEELLQLLQALQAGPVQGRA